MADAGSVKRIAKPDPPEVLPASQYLQEKLQERRARSSRPRRSRQSDQGPQTASSGHDDDIFAEESIIKKPAARAYDSSPLAPPSRHRSSDAGSVNGSQRRPRPQGARQLEQRLDKLENHNFNLQFEIDHRRKHQAKLEAHIQSMQASVAQAEMLTQEHAELLRINEDLVAELEKRDKAMKEAVDIICNLEERIEEAEDDRRSVARSTAQADSGYAGTETHELAPPSSPPDAVRHARIPVIKHTSPAATAASRNLNSIINDISPSKPKRQPLFVSEAKPHTRALRSVYLDSGKQLHSVKSFVSILSKRASTIADDESIDGGLKSPRFSSLSESSFPSIYNPTKLSPDRHAWEPEDDVRQPASPLPLHRRYDSIDRVSQWIEGHDVPLTSATRPGAAASHVDPATRSMSTTPTLTAQPSDDYFQSLGDALTKVKHRKPRVDKTEQFRPHDSHDKDSARGSHTPTSFGGPIFGEPLLSPSPDSASHRLLRASRSTIVGERSILDSTPMHIRGFDPLDPGARTAPKQMRSSVELNSAFTSSMKYHKTGLSTVQQAEDALDSDEDDFERGSATIRDFSSDYIGYPDGNSILMGTPSRFLKHDKPPAGDLFFDGNDFSSPEEKRAGRRRKSSSAAAAVAVHAIAQKPPLNRAGTSPAVPYPLKTTVAMRTKSPHNRDVTSPISYQSTSSSNRTAFGANDARSRPLSPPDRSPQFQRARSKPASRGADRVSASPACLTLTQKTQQLFRRLSGSHGSDPQPDRRERQISPSPSRPTLPTLTSTPSSQYVNVIPKDLRRSNATTKATESSPMPQTYQLPRMTTPKPQPTPITAVEMTTKSPSIDRQQSQNEKRSFFGRRGSFKDAAGLERAKTTGGYGKSPPRKGRRRSSVRDAVTSGKLGWL